MRFTLRVVKPCNLLILALALCCFGRLMLGTAPEPSPDTVRIGTPEPSGPVDSARDSSAPVERSPAHAGANIAVVDTSGSPVSGCRARIADPSDRWIELSLAPDLGTSGADGVVEVDLSRLPSETGVLLMKEDHRPAVVKGLVSGETRRVVLDGAVDPTVAIRSANGAPIEGVCVEVMVADGGSGAVVDPAGAALRIDESTGSVLASKVVTNYRGVARHSGMSPGKYFPHLHLEGTGWVMADPSQALHWEAPGHVEVVLTELHAVVARVVGVDVLAASWGQDRFSPFADPGDLRNASRLQAAEGALRKRFPGCFVRAGILKAGSDGVAALSLTLDGGRMTVHRLQSLPMHQVATPQLLQEAPSLGMTGSVVAHIDLPMGVESPPGAKVAMRWVHDSAVFEVTAEVGQEQAVPEGDCYVGPGGDAPSWLCEPVLCKVARGQTTVVHLDVPCSLARTRIRIRLPDGKKPLEAGLSMRFKGQSLPKLNGFPSSVFVSVEGGDYAFLNPGDEISLSAWVKGYGPTRMVLTKGGGEVVDGEEIFEVAMGQN